MIHRAPTAAILAILLLAPFANAGTLYPIDCTQSNERELCLRSGGNLDVDSGIGVACLLRVDRAVECFGDIDITDTQRNAAAIAAGPYHVCVLRDTQNVDCQGQWSDSYSGGDAVEVDTGRYHFCVLRENGNVNCSGKFLHDWAWSYAGGDAATLSTASTYACALLSNGNVICWGEYVPYSPGMSYNNGFWTVYASGDGAGVAAADDRICILRTSATVTCVGKPGGYGSPDGYQTPDAISVHAGGNTACALTAYTVIVCWGDNTYGEVPVPQAGFLTISPTLGYTCAVDTSGGLQCWGQNAP